MDGHEPRSEDVIPLSAAPGWFAVGDGGGWRGVSEEGQRTALHTCIEAVTRAIVEGWLDGVESGVAPRVTHIYRRRRG